MMKYKKWALILLMSSSVFGRNPFMPPAITPCLASVPTLERWQLKGVIGDGSRFLAWLRQENGKIITVKPRQPFPLRDWQLDEITPLAVRLSVPASCQPQRAELRLKER